MKTFLDYKFKLNLKHNIQKDQVNKILIAFSGGQDSICLLKMIINNKQIPKKNIGIIYIDHQWRYDSIKHVKHIINITQILQIPLYIRQLNPSQYSENESRNLRYQLFTEIAHKYGYTKIFTAHSAADRVETCLYNLYRGSSVDGISGLAWSRKIDNHVSISRPILNFQRAETNWLCRYFMLPVWLDFSNLNLSYSRNRIRQEMLPYLKKHFGNILDYSIIDFLDNSCYDIEYLRQNTIKFYQKSKHPYLSALNYLLIRSQHKALQRRVLRLFIQHNININPTKKIIEDILHKLNSRHLLHACTTINKIKLSYYREWLYITV